MAIDRDRSPRPGTRLMMLGLAVGIVSMLGYAVVERRTVKTPSAQAMRDAAPDDSVFLKPHLEPLGKLEAWPPAEALSLDPPAYEAPYETTAPLAHFRLPKHLSRGFDEAPSIIAEVEQDLPTIEDLPALEGLPDTEELSDFDTGQDLVDPGPAVESSPPSEVASEAPTHNPQVAQAVSPSAGLFSPPSRPAPKNDSKKNSAYSPPRPSASPPEDQALPRLTETEETIDTQLLTKGSKEAAEGTSKFIELWEEASGMPAPAETSQAAQAEVVAGELATSVAVDFEAIDFTRDDAAARLANEATPRDLMLDMPPPGQVAELLAPDVREAFTLGRHGALYAARTRFIGVLRKVANSKDAQQQTDEHSMALAAGLRALEEAVQFVPRGEAIEADLDVAAIAASHGTPLLKGQENVRWTPPNEAVARYHRYAQHKIAAAVSGNQAGSMALHGLGKTYSRLADLSEAPLAERTSLTMYRAAVETHPGNYLAANELGVSLARVGHYDAARETLERAIASGGGSTIYRNLAVVQDKLGHPQLAAAASTRAEQLAVVERSRGAFSRQQGVEWVDRQRLARVGDAYGRQPNATQVATRARPPMAPSPATPSSAPHNQLLPRQNSTTPAPSNLTTRPPQRSTSIADRLMPWRSPQVSQPPFGVVPGPPAVQPPRNYVAPPVRSQTIVR